MSGTQIFCFLRDLAVLRRQKLRTYRSIQNIQKNFFQLFLSLEFDSYVYERLMKFPNREEIFGKQQIYGCDDQICGSEPNLLINATEISFQDLWDLALKFDGVMFPAHIDKTANSLIANLGFIPPDSRFTTAEVKDLKKLHGLKRDNPYLETCRIISSSDAHYLEHISEPELTIQVEERSAAGVVKALLDRPVFL